MIEPGRRVITPQGIGTIIWRQWAAPYYDYVDFYGIKLDGNLFITTFSYKDVKEIVFKIKIIVSDYPIQLNDLDDCVEFVAKLLLNEEV